MANRQIVLKVAGGTRLIEIRHEMTRGLSVSRYRLATPDEAAAREFTTLRKARAAFQSQVAGSRSDVPAGTEDA